MPRKYGKSPLGAMLWKREGVRVVAPLGDRTWSISCPDDLPDRRLRDQLVFAVGNVGGRHSGATQVSLTIGGCIAVLDLPAQRALYTLLNQVMANGASS
jgi:hypothetical protein